MRHRTMDFGVINVPSGGVHNTCASLVSCRLYSKLNLCHFPHHLHLNYHKLKMVRTRPTDPLPYFMPPLTLQRLDINLIQRTHGAAGGKRGKNNFIFIGGKEHNNNHSIDSQIISIPTIHIYTATRVQSTTGIQIGLYRRCRE